MVFLPGRARARLISSGAATAAALVAAGPALAADADLDPSFNGGAELVLPDPLDDGRNFAVDGFQLADGRIVEVTSRYPLHWLRSGQRGDEQPETWGRVIRLGADGRPDPTFAAGGAAGEGAPLSFDGDPMFPLAAAPGPNGTVVVVSTLPRYNRGLAGTPLVLTRLLADGSLDTTFDADEDTPDGNRVVTLGDQCYDGWAIDADRTPEGDFAVLSDACSAPRGGEQGHFATVSRVSLDGDEVSSVDLERGVTEGYTWTDRDPQRIATAEVGGEVRAYVLAERYDEGYDEHEEYVYDETNEVVAVDDEGIVDGFGAGGAVTAPGVALDVETDPEGGAALLLAELNGENADDLDQRLVRWSPTGAAGTATELPSGEPADDWFRLFLHVTFDADDRAHLVATPYGRRVDRTALRNRDARGLPLFGDAITVARLAADGALDPTWGEGGLATLPAPAEDLQRMVLQQGGIFHQADGKLVLASGLFDRANDRGISGSAGTSILRFSGKTREPVVEPPPPPPPGGGGSGGSGSPAPQPVTPTAKPMPCTSRRAFTIRLKPKKARLRSASVKVNGKAVKVSRTRSGRLIARIDLRGRKAGTFKVTVVAKDRRGRTYRETRTYRTCSSAAAADLRVG